VTIVASPELVEWWTTPAGEDLINAVSALSWTPADSLSSTAQLRRHYPDLTPEILNGTIDLVQARQRAVEKLGPASAHWFLTLAAVQQATPYAVTHYRSRRLLSSDSTIAQPIHDATCSVGTEVTALVQAGSTGELSGSDIDQARLAMARHNVPTVAFQEADCLHPVWGSDVITLLDPARRTATGQRRYRGPDATTPSLTAVLEAYRQRPYLMKCAPGIEWDKLFADGWGTGPWQGEVEIISITGSYDGGVKEAALWSVDLLNRIAGTAVNVAEDNDGYTRRRATILSSNGQIVDQITNSAANEAAAADVPTREVGEILIEPDGAIVRAGLVRHWAARHGLWQLDTRIAHLTGSAAPAGVAYYPVVEQMRYRVADIKKALRHYPTSSIEILVRGVDVDPAHLRKAILPKPVSDAPARTLVISRVGSNAVAFLCEARRIGQ